MNKEFVPYEQALALKEIEFDEPCFGYYKPNGELDYIENHILKDFPYLAKNNEWQDLVAAPLYSQAFRWFREKYNITQTIARDGSLAKEGHWAYTIVYDGIYFNDGYLTYEEAEQACLDRLIKIVKNNNK